MAKKQTKTESQNASSGLVSVRSGRRASYFSVSSLLPIPYSLLNSNFHCTVLKICSTSWMHPCAAKSLQSCLTLCDPMDCRPQGSSVHGFSRQEHWSGQPRPPAGDLPHPGWSPRLLHLLHWQVGSLPLVPPGKPWMPSFPTSSVW